MLLHCLQMLRESTATGRAAALEPQELGYHPGVTCDRTGQNPIIGNRYKLQDENYDVCEAEYLKMPEEEQAQYTCVPPPVYRKPKGCGPAKWHLYYWIEVADLAVQSAAAGVAAASLSPPNPLKSQEAVTPSTPKSTPQRSSPRHSSGTPKSAGGGTPGNLSVLSTKSHAAGSPLSWTAKEVGQKIVDISFLHTIMA